MKNQLLLLFVVVSLSTACYEDVPKMVLSLDEQLSADGLTQTKLGAQLTNPYTVENMRIAFDTLRSMLKGTKGLELTKDVELEATDLYVRILPVDTTEYNNMLKDSTMIYYDHPLDYEIAEAGDVYIDTTLAIGQVGWQYTVVKPNHAFADTLTYEILAELFIPENHPDYVEQEEAPGEGRISSLTHVLIGLETLSLYMSDNLPGDEKIRMEEDLRKGKSMRWFWNNPSKWTPKGYIHVQDTELGRIPVRGARVVTRRWFTSKVGYTNSRGYYQTGQFRRPANYKVLWERYHFSIREEGWWFFTRQAWVDGPKRRGDWNLYIPKYTKRWFHAMVFRAAYHYYYGDIKGLRRPPKNSHWKPQMKISAKNSNSGLNGRHDPGRRILGLLSRVQVWRNNRDSHQIYATTIHELAHASHWNMGKTVYMRTHPKVIESWARGVEWELTRMKYQDYRGGTTIRPNYTQVVVDMIDEANDWNTGSEKLSEDNVTGYNIRQIEDALKGKPTWNSWRDNIKNRYNNATEENVDQLFDHWN